MVDRDGFGLCHIIYIWGYFVMPQSASCTTRELSATEKHIFDQFADHITAAVNAKVPKRYQTDARGLYRNMAALIQQSLFYFNPEDAQMLFQLLKNNQSKGAQLLCDLLENPKPDLFLTHLTHLHQERMYREANERKQRSHEIARAYHNTACQAANLVAGSANQTQSGAIVLIDFLEKWVNPLEIPSLANVAYTQFWRDEANRNLLRLEINQHMMYAVLMILQELHSHLRPVQFKVPRTIADEIRPLVVDTLNVVFAHVMPKIDQGRFRFKSNAFGNRGDRVTDRSLFIGKPRGDSGVFRIINTVEASHLSAWQYA